MNDEAVVELEPTVAVEIEKSPEVVMVERMIQSAIFMEDCVQVSLGSGAAEIQKMISYEDFMRIMNSAIGQQAQMQTTNFLLPSNCFFFASSATKLNLSVYHPEAVRDINYNGEPMKITFPNIVISHSLSKDRGDNTWQTANTMYMCTDRNVGQLSKNFIREPDSSQRLWILPFTNTYGDGRMCYGSNVMPVKHEKGNLRALDWYYQFLYHAPFNDDLGVKAIRDKMSARAWFRLLRDKTAAGESFPYSELSAFTPI